MYGEGDRKLNKQEFEQIERIKSHAEEKETISTPNGWYDIYYFSSYGGMIEGNSTREPIPKDAIWYDGTAFDFIKMRGWSINRSLNSLDFLIEQSIPLIVVNNPQNYTKKQVEESKKKLHPNARTIQSMENVNN